MALSAILQLWGGISGLILACFILIVLFNIHRTLVFLVLISLLGSLLLLHYGVRSVEADVQEGSLRAGIGYERAQRQVQAQLQQFGIASTGFSEPFDLANAPFAKIPETEKRRLNGWRRNAFLIQQRYIEQISRFPERLFAASMGLNTVTPIAMPTTELAVANNQVAQFTSTRVSGLPWFGLGMLLVTFAVLWLILWFAFRDIRTKRMQENIPTSKSAGVVCGLAEVKGKLVPEDAANTLTGPISDESCVWYRYVIRESSGSGKKNPGRWCLMKPRNSPFIVKMMREKSGYIRVKQSA